MNIFFLDENPVLAAQYQFDIHVNKMMIESAQLLSTAHHVLGVPIDYSNIYKPTHRNHPMSKWVYENRDNYLWLLDHAVGLSNEFSFRRKTSHKTQLVIEYLVKNKIILDYLPVINSNQLQFFNYLITKPPLCIPDEFKKDDVILSYRECYKKSKLKDKRGIPMNIFTRRHPPEWLTW